MKKIGIVLSIREKSTRLPGKVLKLINGQTVTGHLIDRMKMVKEDCTLIIGTSDDPRDAVFGDIALQKNIEVFYGDPEDKLLRYLQVCKHFNLDGVVIVDGDDILCFPEIMESTVRLLKITDHDVIFWKDLPLGAASSGLTRSALERVIEIKAESDTEVWGGYFTRSGLFDVFVETPANPLFRHPEIRLTMDYEEDYLFFREVFGILYPSDPGFSSADLMELLVNRAPELNKMTEAAQIKYEENIARATSVKFKQ